MKLSTAEAIIELDDRVRTATRGFYHSTVAATVHDSAFGHVFGEIELTVKDILLAAYLGQVHVLITGPTGEGKTDLVSRVCQGLFGSEGWFLLRLNPHLNEEKFATINNRKLMNPGSEDGAETLRDAIEPAPFLFRPNTVLDEINRAPAALTNILLGFCDGRIELQCGMKYDTGHHYERNDGKQGRYHLVFATMNEGEEYRGTFDLDPAMSSRLSLVIPFEDLPPTPDDVVEIAEESCAIPDEPQYDSMIDLLTTTSESVRGLPHDPLAIVYLVYLANLGRCTHSRSGRKPKRQLQEICQRAECRILKKANGFCPSVGGLSGRAHKQLKLASAGLAALRAARTVRAVTKMCKSRTDENEQLDLLRQFAGVEASGVELRDVVVEKYLSTVAVTASDIKAMLPFVVLGGKVCMEKEYVAKQFDGIRWLAAQHYARETYSWLESFFRQHHNLFEALPSGNGAAERLNQVLEHTERFSDPYIRYTIEPFLRRRQSSGRGPDEVAEEVEMTASIHEAANVLAGR